jgi:hypothetical protein
MQEGPGRIVDGDCTFQNVKFKYDGRTPIRFNNNRLHGAIALETDNPAAFMSIAIGRIHDGV